MKRRLFFLLPPILYACFALAAPDPGFIVEPYLQLGNHASLSKKESLALLWHTPDQDADYAVSVKVKEKWLKPAKAEFRRIAVRTIEAHRVWHATLDGLTPGQTFEYRVLKGGQPVFESKGMARKAANQPYRFAVFGDSGQATDAQRKVADQVGAAHPDFVFITGDIVYGRGKISEYRPKHFAIYNGEGRTLLRTTPFIGAPGNHDIAGTDMTQNPDGLAYFYYWDQPLNGPTEAQAEGKTPVLKGDEADRKAFLEAAGGAFPKMANSSFDYGNSHWTVLDSNPNIDWRTPELREWVKRDIQSGRKATWHIAAFHHPAFQSAKTHLGEDQMRVLADVFQENGIDLVLNGHVHNYQRTRPIRFTLTGEVQPRKPVAGEFKMDRSFDGTTNTKPDGIIHIVTGGGGAGLYDPPQQDLPATWQPYTEKFVSQINSFSIVEVDGGKLTFRQIDANGKECDRFVMTK